MSDPILSELFDAAVELRDRRPLGGGCISDVSVVTVASEDPSFWERLPSEFQGERDVKLVLKQNAAEMQHNFRCEASGLKALASPGEITVPAVYAVDQIGGRAYLAMEWIRSEVGRPSIDRFAVFGRQLARLHRATSGDRIGWNEDNYLGSARQPNASCESWPEFFAVRRIGFQIRWACDQGLADRQLRSDCETMIDRMSDLLDGRDESTSLLHGDLWSGNYLFDSAGRPVLIDPAVYHGCREAEWGMIKWFGGCPPEFEDAYRDEWPMPDGWRRRVRLYMLYHQLNHLNLFGGSYVDGCRRTAHEILRS